MHGRSKLEPGAAWFMAAGLLAILALLPTGGQLGASFDKLYNEHRYFELRALLEPETGNSPEILFYKGMAANAFNQPAESADFLNALLRTAGDRIPRNALKDALLALGDDHARLFEYAQAAEVRERLSPLLEKDIRRSEFAAFKSIIGLYRALAGAPPQTVEVPGDVEIALTEAGEIPVIINGLEVPLLPDTGSSLSMIARSDAERLGLEILDITVEVGTATGQIIKARPCLVPELAFAGIRVRNAVFLVVPEEMLYFPVIGERRSGLMAFPILAALKELTFTRGRKLIVTSPPRLQGPPNVFLAGTDPVLESAYEGRRLLLLLDTGAFATQLFPRFFKAFEPEITRRGQFVPARIEGVGTEAKAPIYLVSGLSFVVAGEDVRFSKPVAVLIRATSDTSDVFDGSMGLDVIDGRDALTLNYEVMRLSLR